MPGVSVSFLLLFIAGWNEFLFAFTLIEIRGYLLRAEYCRRVGLSVTWAMELPG